MREKKEFVEVAEELRSAVDSLHGRGWMPGTSSNVSAMIASMPSVVAMSRTGVDKGRFKAADVIAVDRGNDQRNQGGHNHAVIVLDPPGGTASAEALIHLTLYERSGIGAILHTHSVFATVASILFAEEKQIVLSGFELLKGLDGVRSHDERIRLPIFPNTQDMPGFSALLRQELPEGTRCPGFLLAGHGLYTWGADIPSAKRHVEVFEFLLECYIRLRS